MKPKIIVFTTAYYPFIGGAEIAVQETIRRLKDRFEFCIVTHRIERSVPKKEIVDGIQVYRLGFGTVVDRLFLFPFFACLKGLSLIRSFNRSRQLEIRNLKLEIVLWGVMVTYASIGAFFVKLLKPRIPFILTIQEGDSEEHLRFSKLGLTGFWWWLLLKQADGITTISTYLKEYTRRRGYRGPVEVVPNGVDVQRFTTNDTRSAKHYKRIIITTSRLVYKNGIDTLIRAVAEVKKTIPDVQCWIIGDGPEKESLKLKVKSLKLDDHIKFFGSITHDEIPKYLHQADVFVRPSRSEGMGNSFVEALAAGIPIIGTKVGGITDIIEDGETGLFAGVDDPRGLAEKIVQLLQNQGLAEKLVRQGRELVERHFSWDGIAESYQRVFNERIEHTKYLSILIATPLLPPQIGGPALYAKNLGEEFIKAGHRVTMVSFGPYLAYPTGIRHLLYLFVLLREARKNSVIFALDYTSVGLPAAVLSLLFWKPMVIRVEGDFLWEKFVERTRQDIILRDFYYNPAPLNAKEKLIKGISGWVLRRASILVFSSEWRRNMVIEAYGISRGKTAIIRNVFPSRLSLASASAEAKLRQNTVVWAGRMLFLKNLHRLIRAFSVANDGLCELHLVGDGPEKIRCMTHAARLKMGDSIKFFEPLPREKLLEKMEESAFFVLPSLSDVGPNVIADTVSTKTPFIMTKESGYVEYVGDTGLFVDPLNENDIAEKIKMMMDENTRKEYQKKIEQFSGYREWEEAAEEWVKIMQNVNIKNQNDSPKF